jgi:hypothetical protein
MLLRRVIEHVRNQQWTAIGIDLVIVVVGVFIGIQVANWNEARADKAAYQAALGRLGAEIDTNLASLDAFDADIAGELGIGSRALTALQSCVDSDENRRTVDAGLDVIRGTAGLYPRRTALEEITSNPRLLAQQSPAQRQRFSELLFYFDALQKTADSAERRPEESGMEKNPLLRVGAPYASSFKYHGFDWVSTRRKLELGVPVSVACRDNELIKSFFNWERIQGSLPIISGKWRAELVATKKLIEGNP